MEPAGRTSGSCLWPHLRVEPYGNVNIVFSWLEKESISPIAELAVVGRRLPAIASVGSFHFGGDLVGGLVRGEHLNGFRPRRRVRLRRSRRHIVDRGLLSDEGEVIPVDRPS